MAAVDPGGIQRLPADVVGRIAAGEMITRPAAAVKELIENSLDAGATRIQLTIIEAVDRRFEVADDGSGIPVDELPLALERYTTSKIRREEDLLAIESLGFRGEALAAIAEISRVTLVSRVPQSEHAWRVRAEAGRIAAPEAAARAIGTTVIVEDLFFNTPVRKRFLKLGSAEIRLVREIVIAYASAHPGIAWRIEQDGRTVLELSATADLHSRLVQIHGARLAEGLLEVDARGAGPFALRGYVGAPELARPGNRHQMFFVNGRWVVSPWLGQAVRQAYGDLIPQHRAPLAVLFLTLAADRVDVNLHPTKREVRFFDERELFTFVQGSIRPVLARLLPRFFHERETDGRARVSAESGTVSHAGSSGSSATGERHWPAASLDGLEEARRLYGRDPLQGIAEGAAEKGGGDLLADWGAAALEAPGASEEPGAVPAAAVTALDPAVGRVSLWQLHDRYVLAPTRKGFLIIDQHAAHERILYEKALDRMQHESSGSQQLLFPVVLELDMAEMDLYQQFQGAIARIGFDCEPIAERSLLVRGVPPLWHVRGEADLLRDLLDELGALSLREGETLEGLARAFACRAAIKAGEPLHVEEMDRLVDELFATRLPQGDPHGRSTLVFVSLADLDRRFGRSTTE